MVEYAAASNVCGPYVLEAASKDITLYAVNDAGHIYQLQLFKYQGYDSTITLDAVGNAAADDTCISAYKSQGSAALVVPDDPPHLLPADDCAKYRLFFEPPNSDLPISALSADGPSLILPVRPHANGAVLSSLEPSLDTGNLISSMSFSENLTSANKSGTLVFDINADFAGNYSVQVDVDNNGSYTDAADRAFDASAPGGAANGDIEVSFDGKDGLGHDISPDQTIRFRIKFDRLAEIHLTVGDVEGMGGLTMTIVNGTSAGESTVYWDDTALRRQANDSAGPWVETPIIDGTVGVDSAVLGGVHGWSLITTNPANGGTSTARSWGDNRYIDTWVYLQTDIASNLTVMGSPLYTVNFQSNGGSSVDLQKVAPLAVATEPAAPIRQGFLFAGWYGEAALTSPYNFSAPVTGNRTLYAKWLTACPYNSAITDTDQNCQDPNTGSYSPTIPSAPNTGSGSEAVVLGVIVGLEVLTILAITVLALFQHPTIRPQRAD
jgi:uncharacterized repeat protein (TIGR02543 family)